jgi:hypothetical protein
MSSAGFKPAIPIFERPQTYALDTTATVSDGDSERERERYVASG